VSQSRRELRKYRRDRGQALVVVAFAMVALLGFVGLGIDLGYLRYTRRQLQVLADAAALAGAQQLTACTANNCTPVQKAAQNALTENGFTGSTLETQCASGSGGLLLTVNNPPCYLGSKTSDPHYGDNHYVEVVVSKQTPTYFSRIFGVNSETLTARAEATLPGGGSCLFALSPSGTAITLILGDFTSSCGVVDESAEGGGFLSGALVCLIGIFDAPYIGVVGGDTFICATGGGASPTTNIHTPNPADPLAYLQPGLASGAPSPSTCGTSTSSPYTGHNGPLTINSTATLNPGTYCGGLTISPGANVTMNPGIYTLTSTSGSNGGLSIDAGTTVTGNGVGFYNYGPNGGVNFLFSSLTAGNVTLTAPNSTNCSGCASAWQGILFYQDPQDTAASIVVGAASWNTRLTGASYFPNASIIFALDLMVNYDIVVAKNVTLGFAYDNVQVSTNFYNNYSELASGTPIKSSIAVLSE